MLIKLRSTAVLAIVACLLWSTAFVGIKIGLAYTTPMQFAGVRFFLSGMMLLPLVASWRKWIGVLRRHPLVVLKIAFFQTFVLYTLFYQGINLVQGSTAAIIIGSQPLFTAIVAHWATKNDLLTFRKLKTIGLGVFGIVLVAMEKGAMGNAEDSSLQLVGIALLVLANLASGYGNVLVSRQSGMQSSPIALNSMQLSIGGVGLFLVSLLFEPFQGVVFPMPFYVALLWLSFISAAAFTLWFLLLQRPGVKVSDLNIWKFIIPVFGAVFSWVLIPGEKPTWMQVLGMLLIVFSMVLFNLQNRRARLV
jgi:drug/metabolite transporter (DMT)-like permease